ncbi:ribosome silencing factor [Roseomonas stagni]|uniref:Ribosomal silencing factor RsfS n=1 Tax=Falsiroseomonas algicola TaxID=2716930 RepID=A0A6M1LKZ1_9PROT|nr:ribosome silencing factor [Falsiroseomonas algicola]NGM20943.1 ribosome silencing factor [Falsiroseomonas algicola]
MVADVLGAVETCSGEEAAIARTPKTPAAPAEEDVKPKRAAKAAATTKTAAKPKAEKAPAKASAKPKATAAKAPAKAAAAPKATAAKAPAKAAAKPKATAEKAPAKASATPKATATKAPAKAAAKPKAAAEKAPAKAAAKPKAAAEKAPAKAAAKPKAAVEKAPAKAAAKPKATAAKAPAKAAAPKAPRPARAKAAKREKVPLALLDRLVEAARKSLDEDKAEDIAVLDVTGRADYADRLVIATGLSDRQIQAMASHLEDAFEKEGLKLRRDATQASPDWVLIDAGDLVIHLFKPEARQLYALERMWGPDSPGASTLDRTPLPDDGSVPEPGIEDDDEE